MHRGSRILFVTSTLHDPKSKALGASSMSNKEICDPDLLDKLDGGGGDDGQHYSTFPYHRMSKLATVWVTFIMAKQFLELSINCFCPGQVPTTNLNREQPWFFLAMFRYVLAYMPGAISEHKSVSQYLYYATADELNDVAGKYFTDGKISASSNKILESRL